MAGALSRTWATQSAGTRARRPAIPSGDTEQGLRRGSEAAVPTRFDSEPTHVEWLGLNGIVSNSQAADTTLVSGADSLGSTV
jgi:hypothetical protein